MNLISRATCISIALASLFAAGQAVAEATAPQATVTRIEAFSNNHPTTLHNINATGEVVGTYYYGNNTVQRHGFVISDNVQTDIGTLAGATSHAYGINSSGVITGQTTTTGAATPTSGFIYSNGAFQIIPTLGGTQALGRAINDAGQVAGSSTNGRGRYNAFIYSDGEITNLGTLGGDNALHTTYAYDINNKAQIVGQSVAADGKSYAYVWENGQITSLGALPGGTERTQTGVSEARAINDAGQIAGRSLHAGNTSYHAFFYEDGTLTDIGTLGGNGSSSYGINNHGWVVGVSDIDAATNATHAFLYSKETGILDLNDFLPKNSGWELLLAQAISDNGNIIGYGRYTDPLTGVVGPANTAFILSGLGFTAIAAVPEPSTYAMLLGGMGLLGFAVRRRRTAYAA
ncbi:DUF3466 family protein [Methylobacillus pratensis]